MIAANTNNEGKSEPPTEAGYKIKNAFSSFYAFVTGHGPVLQWESSYYIQAGCSAINGEEDEFGRMAGLQRLQTVAIARRTHAICPQAVTLLEVCLRYKGKNLTNPASVTPSTN